MCITKMSKLNLIIVGNKIYTKMNKAAWFVGGVGNEQWMIYFGMMYRDEQILVKFHGRYIHT